MLNSLSKRYGEPGAAGFTRATCDLSHGSNKTIARHGQKGKCPNFFAQLDICARKDKIDGCLCKNGDRHLPGSLKIRARYESSASLPWRAEGTRQKIIKNVVKNFSNAIKKAGMSPAFFVFGCQAAAISGCPEDRAASPARPQDVPDGSPGRAGCCPWPARASCPRSTSRIQSAWTRGPIR